MTRTMMTRMRQCLATPVPEPASVMLWLAAPALFFLTRRRKRRATGSQPQNQQATLRGERLEDRLALSGFGPEDGAYIVEPWVGTYNDVKIQPGDQAIVAAGGGGAARYDSVGEVDTSFGMSGVATIVGLAANGVTLQADGKIVVAGSATTGNGPDIAAARFNADGSTDASFSGDGVATLSTVSGSTLESAWAVGLKASGKVVVAGNAGSGTGLGLVASFTGSGAVDSGKGGFGTVSKGKAIGYKTASELWTSQTMATNYLDAAVQPDDRTVVVGYRFYQVNNSVHSNVIVARYTASGILDSTFSGNGWAELSLLPTSNAQGQAVALQGDGKIVVAGWTGNRMLVARYHASGTLDATFGGGSGYTQVVIDGANYSSPNDIAIQPDGKIIIAGEAFLPASNIVVARLNPSGELDTSFGNVGYKLGSPPPAGRRFAGNGVALQADGSIIVAGSDSNYSGAAVHHALLMRFYGDSPAGSASSSSHDAAIASWLADIAAAELEDESSLSLA